MRKTFYYVGVLDGDCCKVVTSIDTSTRTCKWDEDEKPMVFTAERAEDVASGLVANLIPAFVIKSHLPFEAQFGGGNKNF